MCGNHPVARWSCRTIRGSPPRVREPLIAAASLLINAGITPACAGTTPDHLSPVFRVEDHPRVCGNHPNLSLPCGIVPGSPPRVREPPAVHQHGFQFLRITPACAGTTAYRWSYTANSWDHPRVCGNHSSSTLTRSRQRGSPPRVREPLLYKILTTAITGITPACAGTTEQAITNVVAA